tara:strand:+ start:9551 stop:10528 length:978 start_codon:yes stop_codon:yes gene_type:complete
MTLHENTELFNEAIRATAQRMGILDIYIEKDYWVCYTLYLIYTGTFKDEAVFKGGTALSKCYSIIERFSEDIDLVLLRNGDETGGQLKTKLRKITKALTAPFVEEEIEGITNKMGMIRKIAYTYPKVFKGDFGQVREYIIVEASWLGHFEPYSTQQISSYIYEMMINANQEELAKTHHMLPFDVNVLDVRRTFCEKIMSMVRFSHTKSPIVDLNNKIRHLYDIHMLLQMDEIKEFFTSAAFEDMLVLVAKDDIVSFKTNNEWLEVHPKDAMIFSDSKNVWKQLTNTYNTGFKNLVYGELPKEEDILRTIQEVSSRLESITWNIKV